MLADNFEKKILKNQLWKISKGSNLNLSTETTTRYKANTQTQNQSGVKNLQKNNADQLKRKAGNEITRKEITLYMFQIREMLNRNKEMLHINYIKYFTRLTWTGALHSYHPKETQGIGNFKTALFLLLHVQNNTVKSARTTL